jgi:hypothetical protein
MSERELVREAIRFANADADGEDRWRFLGLSLGAKVPFKKFKRVRDRTTLKPAYQPEQDAFRLSLAEIVRGDELSEPKRIAEAASHMLLIPRVIFEGRELQLKHQYVPENLEAALSYVLLLLVDPSKEYGRALSQCHLDRCGKFFFIVWPKTGRPRTKYCSNSHMEEVHQATALQRVRKSRAKKRSSKANKRTKR